VKAQLRDFSKVTCVWRQWRNVALDRGGDSSIYYTFTTKKYISKLEYILLYYYYCSSICSVYGIHILSIC
jgi:hypothetical protein